MHDLLRVSVLSQSPQDTRIEWQILHFLLPLRLLVGVLRLDQFTLQMIVEVFIFGLREIEHQLVQFARDRTSRQFLGVAARSLPRHRVVDTCSVRYIHSDYGFAFQKCFPFMTKAKYGKLTNFQYKNSIII